MRLVVSMLILLLIQSIVIFVSAKSNWQILVNSSLQLVNLQENKQIRVAKTLPKFKRPTLLFIGDSIMLGHYSQSLLCGDNNDFPIYDSVYITDWKHVDNMINNVVPEIDKIKGYLDVVFINFALLHNLQASMSHDEYSNEFRIMNAYFEAMMQKEILAYIDVGANVVITSPIKICDENFYGDYKHFIEHEEKYLFECALKIKRLEEKNPTNLEQTKFYDHNMTQPSPFFGNLTNFNNSYNFCTYSTMDMHGSMLYAERMKSFVSYFRHTFPNLQNKLHFFDYHNITTLASCDYARDGRHYNQTFQSQYVRMPQCQLLQTITVSTVQ